MNVYGDTIKNKQTKESPWYVFPANNNWFTRIVVPSAVISALNSLELKYPDVTETQINELAEAKKILSS